jgi:hypothetical protein
MSNNSKYGKEGFIRFVLSTVDPIGESVQKAREYLEAEGLDAETIASEGMRRIRKMRLRIQAEQTKKEMTDAGSVKRKAVQWVDRLLSDADFSFTDFVVEENISLQNRNLDSLSEEDMRNTLIQYFTMKFLDSLERGTDA